ncbi:hypothetical protein Pvag_2750 [Pantoea vagans C9-1]|jgi:hypothetical protein|nr:hypothetical protein Pvag_2750 [Pantoea vagans C9-1]
MINDLNKMIKNMLLYLVVVFTRPIRAAASPRPDRRAIATAVEWANGGLM